VGSNFPCTRQGGVYGDGGEIHFLYRLQ